MFARDYLFFAILIFARVIKRVRPQGTINVFLMLLGLSRISLFKFEKCAPFKRNETDNWTALGISIIFGFPSIDFNFVPV